MNAEALRVLEQMVLVQPGWMRSGEPWFRHWDRLPEVTRKALAAIRSDDLRRLRWDYVRPWVA